MKQKISKFISNPTTIFIAVFALTLILNSQGYCDDGLAEEVKIDKMAGKVQDLLFGKTIRKVALTLGLGAGLFQSFMVGSIRPLLIYGGIGVAVCFLPNIANIISGI